MKKIKKISIFGGGFSGVSLAWALHKLAIDCEIHLFESAPQLGGLLKTEMTEWGLAEPAANAILRSTAIDEMARDFSVNWAPKKSSARHRWVMTAQGPRRWPLTWKVTLKNFDRLFLTARGVEKLTPHAGESVWQWGNRVFRDLSVVTDLIGPALQGIYAGDIKNLSASLCLSSLFNKNRIQDPRLRTKGSHAPELGMGEFFVKAQSYFAQTSNVKVFLQHQLSAQDASDITQASDWVIDTRPNSLGLNIEYIPIVSVTLFWDARNRPKISGFGCLFPDSKEFLGVLFDSDIFYGRTSQTQIFSEKWIVRPDATGDWDLQKLLAFRHAHLQGASHPGSDSSSNSSPRPIGHKVFVHPQGIPQYSVELEAQLLQVPKTYFQGQPIFMHSQNAQYLYHGNYLGDLGLNKIFNKSKVLADYIVNSMGSH